MTPMNKSQEDCCTRVLKQAHQLVGTLSPSEALAKAATDQQLEAGFIPIVCTAYNTGCQEAQRRQGGTVLEKFAAFPLADPETVKGLMYPKPKETPGQKLQKEAVDAAYDLPPVTSWRNRERTELLAAPFRKVAAAEEPTQPTEVVKFDEHCQDLTQARRLLKQAEYDVVTAQDRLNGALYRLAGYFKYARDRMSFASVAAAAEAVHGKPVNTLMDVVYKMAYLREAREPATHQLLVYDSNQEPFNHIRECFQAAREKYAADRRVKAAQVEESRQYDAAFYPDRPPPLTPRQKMANMFGGLMTGAGSMVGAGGISGYIRNRVMGDPKDVFRTVAQLDSPEHEQTLRGLRTTAVMHEMLTHDPVLRGHTPEEVSTAYNELARLAPQAMSQPAAIRTWVRRRLQSPLESFELAELSNLERSIRTSSAPTPVLVGDSGGGGE